MRRNYFIMLCTVTVVAGCFRSDKSVTPDNKKPESKTETRAELVAQLVKRGDELSTKEDKWRALYPYEFATFFAPEDASIKKKFDTLKALRETSAGMSLEQAKHQSWVIKNLIHHADHPWPPAAGHEMKELKILNEKKLVSDLQFGYMDIKDKKLAMFVEKPRMTSAAVVAGIGEPTDKQTFDDKTAAMTYGRIRILFDKDTNAAAVMFLLSAANK